MKVLGFTLVSYFFVVGNANNDCHLKDLLMCAELLGSNKFSDLVNQASSDVVNTFKFGNGK